MCMVCICFAVYVLANTPGLYHILSRVRRPKYGTNRLLFASTYTEKQMQSILLQTNDRNLYFVHAFLSQYNVCAKLLKAYHDRFSLRYNRKIHQNVRNELTVIGSKKVPVNAS